MNAQNTLRPEVANRIAYIKTELVNLRTQHQELIKTDRNKAENIFDIITDFEFEMQALATGSIEGVKNLISNVVVNESLRGYQNALTFLQKLQAQPEATAQETNEETVKVGQTYISKEKHAKLGFRFLVIESVDILEGEITIGAKLLVEHNRNTQKTRAGKGSTWYGDDKDVLNDFVLTNAIPSHLTAF